MYFSAVMDFAPVKLSMDVFLVGLRVCECVGGHDSPCLLQLSLPPHSKVLRADLPVGEFRCYLFFFFFYFGGIIARMRNAFFFFLDTEVRKSSLHFLPHSCLTFSVGKCMLCAHNWTEISELEVDPDL